MVMSCYDNSIQTNNSKTNKVSIISIMMGTGDHSLLYLEDNPPKVFNFVYMENRKYNYFENTDTQGLLMKWSMKDQLKIQTFAFVEKYNEAMRDKFVHDFFNDPATVNHLYTAFPSQSSFLKGQRPASIGVTPIKCTQTTLAMFDPLMNPDNGITRGEGHINKCLDDEIGGIFVADELRKMIIDEESEHYDKLTESDRNEFLCKLFGHLVIGGQWCQYEDNIQPYIKTTKEIYKELISLVKREGQDVRIVSRVWRIDLKNDQGIVYFPPKPQNPQNFVYFILEPIKRELTIVTHYFGGSFPVIH